MSNKIITRRTALHAAATAGLGMLAGTQVATAATKKKPIIPIRFDDPIWNRETKAKLDADITGKQVLGAGNGIVHAIRDGEKVLPILRFDIFSTLRVLKQADGSYQRLCKEVVFYRDIKTNKLLDEWDNPLTGERVRVVDVANDPYNYKIAEFFPDPPGYGGLNQEAPPPKRPFILNWSNLSDDTVGLETDVHLLYPSAMQPEKWPRESPGKMTRASEIFRYFIRREDLENPDLTHIPYNGTWVRVTPWLPWMLMDQAPGSMFYVGNMHTRKSLDEYPKDVIERVKERYPQYLTAPETWYGPSLSSLENYERFQKPAPAKAKP